MDRKKFKFASELIFIIIAGLFLLGPSIFDWVTKREIISIAYQTDVCSNMIVLTPKIKEKVKITFDEQDAKSAFLYKVQIENDGNKPIIKLPVTIVGSHQGNWGNWGQPLKCEMAKIEPVVMSEISQNLFLLSNLHTFSTHILKGNSPYFTNSTY